MTHADTSVESDRKLDAADTTKDGKRAFVEKQLMEQACILFAKKGYAGTTLSDIAEAVGLTRAAVYYYFRNKEALLEAIMSEVTSAPLREIEAWRKTAPTSSAARLRSFVCMRIHGVLSRQIQMRMIEVTEAILPQDLMQRHIEAKRRILDEYREILREGMENGTFHAQSDRVAAFGIIGIVNWTTTWFAANKGATVDQVAEQLAEMAVRSVAISADRREGFTDANSALKLLREDVDQLALLLSAKNI